MSDTPALHPDLASAAFLLGMWRGEGSGSYPTVESFRYREETRFSHDGRPFLFYEQSTWRGEPEMPSHSERGYWRVFADGRVEAVIAQTGGASEVAVGTAEGGRVELASTSITLTPSAKAVIGLWRVFVRDGDELRCEVDMAAVGRTRQFHLRSTLHLGPD